MKTLPADTRESKFDLHALEAIDTIELTDEELEQATGSWFGSPGFGFRSPGFGFGGFGTSFTSFTSFTSATSFTGGGFSGGGFGPFF